MQHKHGQNLVKVFRALMESASTGGVTLQQLTDTCGVSRRQIYRYLKEIEQLGIDIERPQAGAAKRKGIGYYRLNPNQDKEFFNETILLMYLNELLINYHQYKNYILFLKEYLIKRLATRYGLYHLGQFIR